MAGRLTNATHGQLAANRREARQSQMTPVYRVGLKSIITHAKPGTEDEVIARLEELNPGKKYEVRCGEVDRIEADMRRIRQDDAARREARR